MTQSSATQRASELNNLDHMLQRNKEFAARQSAEGTLMPSSRALPTKAIVIGCADMRVDPVSTYLESKPGEAVVMCWPSAVESRRGCWKSWDYSGESVKLPERFLEAAGSFISSYFITPIVVSLALSAIPPIWRTIFKIQEGELKARAVTDPRGGGRGRRCCTPGDSCIAQRLAYIRPRVRRGDWTCRDRRTASADSYCANS